jgi:hypothetical protein
MVISQLLTNKGYQIPEYTTYSEVLAVFKRLIPIPTPLEAYVSPLLRVPSNSRTTTALISKSWSGTFQLSA